MLTRFAIGLSAAALLAGTAFAQTQGATQPVGQGQVMTQMPQNLMRGSQLMGVDVYGADNQKIGDIDEVLLDRQGKIHGLVVGVGGFLGIGQKDVAIPFEQVQWMSNQEVQAQSNQGGNAGTTTTANTGTTGGTNTAGGVTAPNAPATTGSTTSGNTGTAGSSGMMGTAGNSSASDNNSTAPARAMVRMTKADLQNAPEFRYGNDANRSTTTGTTGGSNTNPPANANRPATAPQ
ncbi:MAG TPA: PRC-barrel domain-containing protein [Microvirga sp.]